MYNFTPYNILINKTYFIMKKLLLLIIAIIAMNVAANVANAQWVQTSFDSTDVRSITINGTNIFVGTIFKGVFLSTNSGNNWTAINNGLPSLDISSVATIGANVFASSYSGGIFRSTDNGANWNIINNGLSNLQINSLFIDGLNIFACTSAGVFKSTSNGNSWSSIGLSNYQVFSLASSGDTIIAGALGGIFKSSNNVYNWTPLITWTYDVVIHSLALKGNNIFAGAGEDGTFLSKDRGISWTNINLVAVNFNIYNSNIFASTYIGAYLSNNNDSIWALIGLPDVNIRTLAFDSTYIYAGTYNVGIWKRLLSDFTGIKENTSNNISVYPNPTNDILTIETNLNTPQKLEISNLMGQTIYTYYIYNKATINTSAFAKGVYILKLNSDKETVVRKIVKE